MHDADTTTTPSPEQQFTSDDFSSRNEGSLNEDDHETITSETSCLNPSSAQNVHTLSYENRAILVRTLSRITFL